MYLLAFCYGFLNNSIRICMKNKINIGEYPIWYIIYTNIYWLKYKISRHKFNCNGIMIKFKLIILINNFIEDAYYTYFVY